MKTIEIRLFTFEELNNKAKDKAASSPHTPGPWHIGVRQPNSDKFVYGAQGTEVANCDMLTNLPDENLANARLIAASPAMAKVLAAFVQRLDCQGNADWSKFPADNQLLADQARSALISAGYKIED